MKYFILLLLATALYAQCEHIKPVTVKYVGLQLAETIENDSLNCIIFTRQKEEYICPVCKFNVVQESIKDTVIFWRKEE